MTTVRFSANAVLDGFGAIIAAMDEMEAKRADMVELANWMAASGEYSASDVAYAMEKPWKYAAELAEAKAARAKGEGL